MTIIIHTKNPESLYRAINIKINNDELKTWEIKNDSEEKIFYNHSPDQWTDRVLLKPMPHIHGLQMEVYWWENNQKPDNSTKGYILGRFTEILMVHFRSYFEKIELQ